MASALTLVRKTGSLVVDSAAEAGSALAIGYVFGRYRDHWYGERMPAIAAVAGKVGAALLHAQGMHKAADMANSFGSAGLVLHVAQYGIEMGAKARATAPAAIAPGAKAIVGAIPPAAYGRALSDEEVGRFRAMH
jgi:hypothetical protein